MYTHIKPSEGAPGHTLGVLGAEMGGGEEPPDGLSTGLLSKRPFPPDSLPSGLHGHQGLELKQETRFGLKKKEAGGVFFLPFFTQYYDTNLKNKSQFLCFPSQVFTELRK